MVVFKLRRGTTLGATVLYFFLLSSATQVATVALERRDPTDADTTPYCDPKVVGNPDVTAHDCNVAFYNLGFQGDNKVVRSDKSWLTSVFGTCRVLLQCPSAAQASAGRMLTNNNQGGGFLKIQEVCSSKGLTGQINIEGACVVRTTSSNNNV
ncbi:hypothetical protein PTTG_27146 [Puccinia triticina 1-1 BBBD Race 1]|uniref:Cyanovirin-N domain-containing protein n=2 Tax=Puccinia triticina TaxID=208348 RepID=A0A180GMH6_PUCT1|nr:uncharacterized protein PtA15_2A762 [Puccinia triticina]OAV93920.1 hypothetical protein PTTG_27146 [Puccinia triticina 1-1 BBBD Race 1]WAQ82445.1 hypothetical protein PtA15_2A762 [Puccinia triticina]WAR53299.1 hypothetical protein PtB15_2B730 [Puccinia triticina]